MLFLIFHKTFCCTFAPSNQRIMKRIQLFLLLLIPTVFLQAAFFQNVPHTLQQPNGDTLSCFLTGDEYYHYLHDADGFTIIKNPQTGYYVYAVKDGDRLVPSSYVAGTVSPRNVGLVPHVNISAEEWRAKRKQIDNIAPTLRDGNGQQNRGTLNNIVIFIRFADDTDFTTNPVTVYNMFNAPGDDAISLYNYYKNVSYNQLEIISHFFPTPTGTTILSYQDSHNRNYYLKESVDNPEGYTDEDEDEGAERTEREMALVTNAIEYVRDLIPADLDIDNNRDGYVDNITFIIKGEVAEWSDILWPHKWNLYTNSVFINGSRVWDFNVHLSDNYYYFSTSVICHEMGHSLGMPDLYHYDNTVDMTPVGRWDLMGTNENIPQHSGAWMKHRYGNWIDEMPEINESGTYTLYPLSSSTPERVCYRIASEIPTEFFVLEYRRNYSLFEMRLPGTGLIIYRINELFCGNALWNGDDSLDEIYIYRPFGTLTENGNLIQAYFSSSDARGEFSYATNPKPFLSNGYISALRLYDITVFEDSLTFKYLRPGDTLSTSDFPKTALQVYPNPASDEVTVDFNFPGEQIVEAFVTNIAGKKVAQLDFQKEKKICVKEYSKGIYVLHIKLLNGEKMAQKIVVQ